MAGEMKDLDLYYCENDDGAEKFLITKQGPRLGITMTVNRHAISLCLERHQAGGAMEAIRQWMAQPAEPERVRVRKPVSLELAGIPRVRQRPK